MKKYECHCVSVCEIKLPLTSLCVYAVYIADLCVPYAIDLYLNMQKKDVWEESVFKLSLLFSHPESAANKIIYCLHFMS